MSKHTPGPWRFEEASYGQVICTDSLNFIDIAVVRNSDGLPHHGNARLIASAPELLEALCFCESLIAASGINGSAQTLACARAAIAKATA